MPEIKCVLNNCLEAIDYIENYNKRMTENDVLLKIAHGKATISNKYVNTLEANFYLEFIFPRFSISGYYLLFTTTVLIIFLNWWFMLPFGGVALFLISSDIFRTKWFFTKMLQIGLRKSSYGNQYIRIVKED